MARNAARMSSGRTAGVRCRTTIRSIAHPSWPSAVARRSSSSDTTPALVSSRRIPLLVRRSTSACAAARNASIALAAAAGATPGNTTSHSEASSRGDCATARSATSITSIPAGRAASSRTRTVSAVQPGGEGHLQELGLAGGAGRRPARVRDLGMRREPCRMRDRQASPPNPTLHRTRDIPMTRESHPATLSVPDQQPLNCWQRRWSRRPRLLTRHD